MNIDSSFIIACIAALSNLGTLAVVVRKLTGAPEKREISPDPLRVKPVKNYVTVEECSKNHQSVIGRVEAVERHQTAMDLKLDQAIQRIEEKGEQRASKIYHKIETDRATTNSQFNEVIRAVGRIEGKLKA